MDPILRIQDLTVEYEVEEGTLRGADHVSFDVPQGRIMGLIGESGCGKTTIVEAILRVLPENGYIRGGQVWFEGQDLLRFREEALRRVRWERIAMVFQAAQNALNPVMTVGEQLLETILEHRRMARAEAWARAARLLELVELDPDRVLRAYPHELSGGMKQRAIIAMSLLLDPELLILDEPTTALDLLTQAHLLEILQRLHETQGITMLLVTHDVANVARLADVVAVMYAAKIVEVGSVEEIFYHAGHPYTIGLLQAIPSIVGDLADKRPIPGVPPSLLEPPPGCRFHPRCPYAQPTCREVEPPLREVEPGHFVACHFVAEVRQSPREEEGMD